MTLAHIISERVLIGAVNYLGEWKWEIKEQLITIPSDIFMCNNSLPPPHRHTHVHMSSGSTKNMQHRDQIVPAVNLDNYATSLSWGADNNSRR